MRFAIFVPNFGPFGDPAALVELAEVSERAGWDGIFMWDHINWDGDSGVEGPVADPWVTMGAIAQATSTLRMGTMITPVPRRRPWKLARETTTIDALSGGRLNLGVGIGYPPDLEFGAFGEEMDDRTRAAVLDEGLSVLAGLWSGEEFSYSGEHFTLTPTRFAPPVQQPRIPIWCAAMWPNKRPLRRAARWDGVALEMVGGGTPSAGQIAEAADYMRAHRESEEPFDIATDGYSGEGADSEDSFDEYAAAGLTWWLERIDPDRLFSVEEALARALTGPPGGSDKVGLPLSKKGTP